MAAEVVAEKIPGIRKSFFRTAQECYVMKHEEPYREVYYTFTGTYVAQNEIGGYQFTIESTLGTTPCTCPKA